MTSDRFAAARSALAGPARSRPRTSPDKPIHIIVALHAGQRHRRHGPRGVAAAVDQDSASRSSSRTSRAPAAPSAPAQVAKAAPDGYTLLVNSSAHTVNPCDLSQPDLRHGQGSAGRQPARRAAQHHGRLAGQGLEDRGRSREGGQGAARQAHLCLRRHRQRHPHERREVQARGRHRRPARPLQGHARGAERHDERPHRLSSSAR